MSIVTQETENETESEEDSGNDFGLSLEKVSLGLRKKLLVMTLGGVLLHIVRHNRVSTKLNYLLLFDE